MYLTIFTLCVGESRANSHCQSAAGSLAENGVVSKKKLRSHAIGHPAQLGIMMLVDVSCIMSFQQ